MACPLNYFDNCLITNIICDLDASISVRIHKPEILFLGDLKANNAHVILLQAEVSIESSRHSSLSSIVCTLTDVRAKSKKQGDYSHRNPYWLLCPCDVEICRNEEAPEFHINYTVAVNKINVHLSAEVIHTFIDASTSVHFINFHEI